MTWVKSRCLLTKFTMAQSWEEWQKLRTILDSMIAVTLLQQGLDNAMSSTAKCNDQYCLQSQPFCEQFRSNSLNIHRQNLYFRSFQGIL